MAIERVIRAAVGTEEAGVYVMCFHCQDEQSKPGKFLYSVQKDGVTERNTANGFANWHDFHHPTHAIIYLVLGDPSQKVMENEGRA